MAEWAADPRMQGFCRLRLSLISVFTTQLAPWKKHIRSLGDPLSIHAGLFGAAHVKSPCMKNHSSHELGHSELCTVLGAVFFKKKILINKSLVHDLREKGTETGLREKTPQTKKQTNKK